MPEAGSLQQDAASRRPHVVYVAWGFPPCRGGGVYRALATANALAAGGFRVTVLTATRETFLEYTGADTSLEAEVNPSVEVVRIPFEWPTLETDIRSWGMTRALAPRVWRKARVWADQRDFPEIGYGPWKGPLQSAIRRIHRDDPVDLVIATANPNVDFTAAEALYKDAGVPYVLDHRDAWLLDVFDGTQTQPDGSRADRIERELTDHATEVWFVNEPIRAWHQRRHPAVADRMHVVGNGYDPQYAPEPRLAGRPGPLAFGYIGTVSAKVPMEAFAAGWRLAVADHEPLRNAKAQIWGYLGFYSTADARLAALLAEGADVGLSYEGMLPKARVSEVYDTFDALLLILGTGRYVTSGKVFEYASSALPIVSVHDPGNAASDVLRKYPLWFPTRSLDPADIAAALRDAADAALGADEATRLACRDFSTQYARDHQLVPRVLALREHVEQLRSVGGVGRP